MFDAKRFLTDFNIPLWTRGKNVQEGWVNITCPFCNDTSNHGGFNMIKAYYNCWHCGHKFLDQVVEAITDLNRNEVNEIIERYTTTARYHLLKDDQKTKPKDKASLELPVGTTSLTARHREYLLDRKFDPDRLEVQFKLVGTGHIGPYKFRVIAPIFLNGKMISYQGRDITNKAPLRYKACKKKDEIINHQHSLYNIDQAKKRKAIITEGVTDVWRLGPGTVGIFGLGYTQQQLRMIKARFDICFILFDSSKDANIRANEIAIELSSIGLSTEIILLDKGDPGSMSQDDANHLKKELLGG